MPLLALAVTVKVAFAPATTVTDAGWPVIAGVAAVAGAGLSEPHPTKQAAARLAAAGAALAATPGWADHPLPGMRAPGWDPLTTALVFGGLALLAGAILVVVVAILTRRQDRPE